MASQITIFRATTGINIKADPARIYSSAKGIKDLAVAADVDISDTGRISRRKGYTKRISGEFHSLFCDGGECVFVSGDALGVVRQDYTYKYLRNVTVGARLRCCQVNGDIYYCNGYEKGIIRNSESVPWVKGEYIGPDTHRSFVDPPIGTIVEYYRGRIYVAQGNILWFSESRHYGAFDLSRGVIVFNTFLRMVRALEDGILVSSSRNTYFFVGARPKEFERILIANYPAIEGSDTKFRGTHIFQENGASTIMEGPGESALWLSNMGVCYGGAGGKFQNITWDKIGSVFPDGITGAGVVHNGRYVGLIDP